MERVDVAVVGAGVAGLMAARELRRGGLQVIVLEARDRIGGRILTVHDPRLPVPVELGAEFVHGAAPATHRVLAEAGLTTIDVAGEQWQMRRGRLAPADTWPAIDRILRRIDPGAPDRSFDSFLAGLGNRASAGDRRAAVEFVQGYHAADTSEIGVRSLAPLPPLIPPALTTEAQPGDSPMQLARVYGGYDQLPRWLAAELQAEIRLQSPVAEIAWRRGHVQLTVRPDTRGTERVVARAAIVTVPAGVLGAGAAGPAPDGLRLEPDPPRIRRARGLVAMGAVARVVCWFRELPWSTRQAERRLGSTARAGFLHLGTPTFGICWTAYPVRWPIAVAWSGGPRAAAISSRGLRAVESTAVDEFAAAFGLPRRAVTSRLEGIWMHDWQHDAHSRGAYSYARAGGAGAARTLSRPVEATLFFAGEATDTGGHTGTVEGALASGLRAALQVRRALGAASRQGRGAAAG